MKNRKKIIILGIETSCDETAASLLRITNQYKPRTRTPKENPEGERIPCEASKFPTGQASSVRGRYTNPKIEILSDVVSSQVNIHRKYGGIVPEVAARAHCENIIPVLQECLSNLHKSDHKFSRIRDIRGQIRDYSRSIDLIAVTNGPGLITSLLVGVETAKILSYLWQKPLLMINHLIGHIYAVFSNSQLSVINDRSLFPAICLVASGGHTELILMSDYEKFKKIGETLDDAAGECFDKIAKLLRLGYPGGPVIAKIANLHKSDHEFSRINISEISGKLVKISDIKLPRPMIKTKDYNFSFSGLKTAVLYETKRQKFELTDGKSEIRRKIKKLPQRVRSERKQFITAICAEVQQAIIDVLITKTLRAVRDFNAKTVILCGGVAANKELRNQFKFKINNLSSGIRFLVPPKNLCTDNAAMIASAAYFKWQKLTSQERKNLKDNWQKIKVNPGLEIGK